MARPRGFDEDQVLDRAVEAFWSASLAGTSTQDLCDATGLSRGSLYNTFDNKAELYRRALDRYGELQRGDRQGHLDESRSGREILEELLLETLKAQATSPGRRTCLAVHAAVEVGKADEQIAALVRRNLAAFQQVITELIARGQADGSVTAASSAAHLGSVVHAALNGLQVRARVAQGERDARRAVRTLMSLL